MENQSNTNLTPNDNQKSTWNTPELTIIDRNSEINGTPGTGADGGTLES